MSECTRLCLTLCYFGIFLIFFIITTSIALNRSFGYDMKDYSIEYKNCSQVIGWGGVFSILLWMIFAVVYYKLSRDYIEDYRTCCGQYF